MPEICLRAGYIALPCLQRRHFPTGMSGSGPGGGEGGEAQDICPGNKKRTHPCPCCLRKCSRVDLQNSAGDSWYKGVNKKTVFSASGAIRNENKQIHKDTNR
ncbi:hypothetical protein ElyMa_001608400 [Elysia marginata]|uniref:Uncharacterized protein n=1 Tax=Elysia marginata TaxID=1093978 RepID=A0AAV4JIZ9_9GAST|nr:hypothetical protein ElyMa_001608400 [Elysia marginata]